MIAISRSLTRLPAASKSARTSSASRMPSATTCPSAASTLSASALPKPSAGRAAGSKPSFSSTQAMTPQVSALGPTGSLTSSPPQATRSRTSMV